MQTIIGDLENTNRLKFLVPSLRDSETTLASLIILSLPPLDIFIQSGQN